jgi:sulfur carrier protein
MKLQNNWKKFLLNGHEYYINEDLTLSQVLQYFNYHNNLFVLEYNNLICHKNDWGTIKINSNDKIEIITIVGGG